MANPMREIKIEKVTLNIGIGETGSKLERAKNLLESLTDKKVVKTKAKRRSSFGLSRGRPIGVRVTLRGENAKKFLERVFETKEGKIKEKSFDKNGNFSVGIHEHIDMPGVRYDPKIGIFGMDVCVTLERPGYRVKRKKISKKIGKSHKISKEESINFIKKNFKVDIV